MFGQCYRSIDNYREEFSMSLTSALPDGVLSTELLEHFIRIENFGMTLEDRDNLLGMRAVLAKESVALALLAL